MNIYWKKLEPEDILEHGDIMLDGDNATTFDMNGTLNYMLSLQTGIPLSNAPPTSYRLPELKLCVFVVGSSVKDFKGPYAFWRPMSLNEPTSEPTDKERKIDLVL